MRKILLGCGLLAACAAGSANAAFTGFAAASYAVNVGGTDYAVMDVYAMYSSTQDKFLNVFNSNITLVNATNFYQSNGTWNPTNTGSNAADSKAQAGANTGNTSADGSFLNWEDSEGDESTLPPSPGAGWFTTNPSPANNSNGAKVITPLGPLQGAAGAFGVVIGRFSLVGITDGPRQLNFSSQIGSGVVGGSGTFFGNDSRTFNYVPAPGALALLGLAGIAGRRRRA